MQCLAILAKILGASHQPAHLFQDRRCAAANLAPCPAQPMNWGSPEGRDDGCKGRVVVEGATSLYSYVSTVTFKRAGKEGMNLHQQR